MPVRRYVAEFDTTITNSYRENLTERGEDANMGLSDSLEVFTLYDQTQAVVVNLDGTVNIIPQREEARILIQFPADEIDEDWLDYDDIDEVRFFLRLFNAEHPFSLPKSFDIEVYSLTRGFDEGHGLDMEEYTDEGAANWLYATETPATFASGALTITTNPSEDFDIQVGGHSEEDVSPAATSALTAIVIAAAINGNGAMSQLVVATPVGNAVQIAATVANGNSITYAAELEDTDTGEVEGDDSTLSGGVDGELWTTPGGDFTTLLGTVHFDDGDEDLELDVTDEVLDWISGGEGNGDPDSHLGFVLKISDENAAQIRSYYTKKFFARGTQFFFSRPAIEARWSDFIGDNRGNFFANSPLVSAANNINNLYLFNRVGGDLVDIPGDPTLEFKLWLDEYKTDAVATADYDVTITKVDTGIYRADVVLRTDGTVEYVYEEWLIQSTQTSIHFNELVVNERELVSQSTNEEYVINITNLKSTNSPDETAKLRLHTRLKNWSPTVYHVATADIDTQTIEQAYYRIVRTMDDLVVVDYGFEAEDEYCTRMSYDENGNFFELEMGLFEPDYAYSIYTMFVINGEYREQSEVFKFRVERLIE